MKKQFIASLAVCSIYLLSGCGGGQSIPGGSAKGFYSMSLNLDGSTIVSPAYDPNLIQYNPPWPSDTITGTITLNYSGPTNTIPLDGYLENAEICFQAPTNKCYTIPLAGVVKANSSIKFSFPIITHKYEAPWIILNPIEDTLVNPSPLKVQIGTGNGYTKTFSYTLPQDTNYPDGSPNYIDSEIVIYRNNSVACSLPKTSTSPTECSITRDGQYITVTFTNPPNSDDNISVEYRQYYDFNPSIDASRLNHLYYGRNYADVNANIKVRVKLYDGTHLDTAPQTLTFQVIPTAPKTP